MEELESEDKGRQHHDDQHPVSAEGEESNNASRAGALNEENATPDAKSDVVDETTPDQESQAETINRIDESETARPALTVGEVAGGAGDETQTDEIEIDAKNQASIGQANAAEEAEIANTNGGEEENLIAEAAVATTEEFSVPDIDEREIANSAEMVNIETDITENVLTETLPEAEYETGIPAGTTTFWRPWLLILVGILGGAILTLLILQGINGTLVFESHPRVQNLSDQVADLTDQNETLFTQLEGLKNQLETITTGPLQNVETDIQGLQGQAQTLDVNAQELQKQINTLQESASELTAQITAMEQGIASLEGEVTTLSSGTSAMADELNTLKADTKGVQEIISKLQADTSRFDRFLTSLQELLSSLEEPADLGSNN